MCQYILTTLLSSFKAKYEDLSEGQPKEIFFFEIEEMTLWLDSESCYIFAYTQTFVYNKMLMYDHILNIFLREIENDPLFLV